MPITNQTIGKLNKMCTPALRAGLGTVIDTLVTDLSANNVYSGALLTDAQVSLLNKMCDASKDASIGTVVNAMLTASKNNTTVTVLSDTLASKLDKMCTTAKCVSNTEDGTTTTGFGQLIKWCQTKVNSMSGEDVYSLDVTEDAGCEVSVKRENLDVGVGEDVLAWEDVLTITATAETGYTVASLKVNGEDFTSGNTYTVKSDVDIVATSTAND